jgi:alanine dehydrogenase
MLIVPEALIAAACVARRCLCGGRGDLCRHGAGRGRNFPVVREALGEGRQYGFKSGLDRAAGNWG